MADKKDAVRVELRIDRASARRALFVGVTLVVVGVGAKIGFAVPVTFSDGNVLTAKQLNDDFSDLDQRITAAGKHGDVSGTRLKGKYILGTDGTKQYQKDVWYDSQLDTDCVFTHAGDGKIRCLPTGLKAPYGSMRFTDDKCTQPLVTFDQTPPQPGCPAQPTPTYVLVTQLSPPNCTSQDPILDYVAATHVYPLGAFSGSAATFVQLDTCQGNSPLGSSTWHVGAELDPTSFVEATNGTDP
ncbi:MAG TPA: hypothetical protein VHE30_14275 [Polyangiaceae bacterium]|nr:hypothetical protein [Polyangiaceae bacterium]